MNFMTTAKRLAAATLLLGLLLPSVASAYQAAPVAVTKQATFVTEKIARLNGQTNPSEMPDAYMWFEWGISGRPNTVFETPHRSIGGLSNTLIDQSADIIGLAPQTQYFYRQVAENGRGKSVGATVYFTTKALAVEVPPLLIIGTEPPAAIAETTATLKGYISPHGDTKTRAWFQWGITQNFEAETPPQVVSPDATVFVANLANLTPGTLYFYRVVGENSVGKIYGASRVFTTTGTPPLPPEAPIVQKVQVPEKGSDGVTRTTTTSGTKLAANEANVPANYNVSGDTQYGLPGVSSGYRPGDVLGAIFRKRDSAKTAAAPTAATAEGQTTNTVSPAAGTNPISKFWNNVTGRRGVEVTVEKIGPKKVVAHTPVEYRVSYTYRQLAAGQGAQLKIILPADVIYIGDNTNNELLLEEGQGPERTYVLPLGTIEGGSTRTISLLGMTTGDAKGFPEARARLEYGDALGIQVVSSGGTASAKTASVAKSGDESGMLPGSLLGWIFYVLLVVLLIIGIRKARTYYLARKEAIETEEHETGRRDKVDTGTAQELVEQA